MWLISWVSLSFIASTPSVEGSVIWVFISESSPTAYVRAASHGISLTHWVFIITTYAFPVLASLGGGYTLESSSSR